MTEAAKHTPTLKPCPFCGETEELYPGYRGRGAGKPYQIDCCGCGIDFEPREGIDVIEAWNRRTPDLDQALLIESLTKALEAIKDDPSGCVFCDSGKLRNPAKPHEDDCGFVLADTALAATMPRRCDTNQVGGMGECLACDAEQGVYCLAPRRTALASAQRAKE